MSHRASNAVWRHSEQSGGALTLMLALADVANDDGDVVYGEWDTERLACKCRVDDRSIRRLLKRLSAPTIPAETRELDAIRYVGRGKLTRYRVRVETLLKKEDKLSSFSPERGTNRAGKEDILSRKGGQIEPERRTFHPEKEDIALNNRAPITSRTSVTSSTGKQDETKLPPLSPQGDGAAPEEGWPADVDPGAVWQQVLGEVRPQMNATNFNTFWADSRGVGLADGALLVEAKEAGRLGGNFAIYARSALGKLGYPTTVRYVVAPR